MRKTILALSAAMTMSAPTLPQASTVTTFEVDLASAGNYNACLYAVFDSNGVWYAVPRSDPAFTDAKQLLFTSFINGLQLTIAGGSQSACGYPTLKILRGGP
jgi:hypothetical protein